MTPQQIDSARQDAIHLITRFLTFWTRYATMETRDISVAQVLSIVSHSSILETEDIWRILDGIIQVSNINFRHKFPTERPTAETTLLQLATWFVDVQRWDRHDQWSKSNG